MKVFVHRMPLQNLEILTRKLINNVVNELMMQLITRKDSQFLLLTRRSSQAERLDSNQ